MDQTTHGWPRRNIAGLAASLFVAGILLTVALTWLLSWSQRQPMPLPAGAKIQVPKDSDQAHQLRTSVESSPVPAPPQISIRAGTTEIAQVDPIPVEPPIPFEREVTMPDISGIWAGDFEVPLKAIFGLLMTVEHQQIIRRSAEPGYDFSICESESPLEDASRLKWIPGTRRFEYLQDAEKKLISPPTLELSDSGDEIRLRVNATPEELKELAEAGGTDVATTRRLLDRKWRRVAPDAKTETTVPDIAGVWNNTAEPTVGFVIRPVEAGGPAFLIAPQNDQLAPSGRVEWNSKIRGFEGTVSFPETNGGTVPLVLVLDPSEQKLQAEFSLSEKQRQELLVAQRKRATDNPQFKIIASSRQVWTRSSDEPRPIRQQQSAPVTVTETVASLAPAPVYSELPPQAEQESPPVPQPPVAKLRFQFQNHSWADVLNSVAESARWKVELQATPPGTFSYVDPETYTPQEAVQIMNGFLLPKGYLLEQSNQSLSLRALQPPTQTDVKAIAEHLEIYERAAVMESALIRRIETRPMSNGNSEQQKKLVAEHQQRLTGLVTTALDLKFRLEESQIRELRSRMTHLEQQLQQRKQLREKIVARRVNELQQGEISSWIPGASPQEKSRIDNGSQMMSGGTSGTAAAAPAAATPTADPLMRSEGTSTRPRSGSLDVDTSSTVEIETVGFPELARLPSLEEIRRQIEPFVQRMKTAAAAIRKWEADYFRDRSHIEELQAAVNELAAARAAYAASAVFSNPELERFALEYGAIHTRVTALAQQYETKSEEFMEGKATASELNAIGKSLKQAKATESSADAWNDAVEKMMKELTSEVGHTGADGVTLLPPASVKDLDLTSETSLIWLQAMLGVKLEFVTFQGLTLPFRTALRVREDKLDYHSGDLIFSLNERLFDSPEQAVAAIYNKLVVSPDKLLDTSCNLLRGGLAGTGVTLRLAINFYDQDHLKPTTAKRASTCFEVRLRGVDEKEARTDYCIGVGVSLDGLVVLPLSRKQLADEKALIPLSGRKATARILASDDERGLMLVRLESPHQALFPWVKCREGYPGVGQNLFVFDGSAFPHPFAATPPANNRAPAALAPPAYPAVRYSDPNTDGSIKAGVIRLNQPYPSRSGADAFEFVTPWDVSIVWGMPATTIDGEVQGIAVGQIKKSDEKSTTYQAIPAVHIITLINKYRHEDFLRQEQQLQPPVPNR